MKLTTKIELDKDITLVESAYISEYTESGITVITINLTANWNDVEYLGEGTVAHSLFVITDYSKYEDSEDTEEVLYIPYHIPVKHIISKSKEKNQVLFIITPRSLFK